MPKIKILIISLIMYLISGVIYSQTKENNYISTKLNDSIGLRTNPLNNNARDNMASIFSTSYGYRNIKFLKIGTEISGYYLYKEYPLDEIYGVSLAIYPGHSHSSDNRTKDFSKPYHLNNIYFDNEMRYKSSDGYIYIAPGISVFSKNRKFSLDIYHKLSTPLIIDGIQPIIPYKINLHF